MMIVCQSTEASAIAERNNPVAIQYWCTPADERRHTAEHAVLSSPIKAILSRSP